MKHTSQQTRPLSLPSKVQQRGFALISTISIMVLLVLIVIGMLALSTTETKKAKQSEHQLVAQANARMALMIALSEAQEALGPDRRISAYATILDTNAESDDIDGVNNPRLLGVWDSWGAWLNTDYTKDDGTKLPAFASLSKFGVTSSALPCIPTVSHRCWSVKNTSTFGFLVIPNPR